MLKKTGVILQLVSDVEKFKFIERGVRCGVSHIAYKFSTANNKHMSDHDPTKESKHIMYLHPNNLYGWAMSQKLPTGDSMVNTP